MQREEIKGNHIKCSIKTRDNRKMQQMRGTKIQPIGNSYEHDRY